MILRDMAWFSKELVRDRDHTAPVTLASEVTFLLLSAHPFADGNGRVARALGHWVLDRAGYTQLYSLRLYFNRHAEGAYCALVAREIGDARVRCGEWSSLYADAVAYCFIAPRRRPVDAGVRRPGLVE